MILLALLPLTFGFLYSAEELSVERIRAHLTIGDVRGAKEEVEWALQNNRSQALLESAVRVFSEAHDEKRSYQLFLEWEKQNPTTAERKALIEEMAWGTIEKHSYSGSPFLRALSTLAASLQQDKRSVLLMERLMEDPHQEVRKLAIGFASQYPDERITRKVIERLSNEQELGCRVELIGAIGQLKMGAMHGTLIQLIQSSRSRMEEKVAAIQSLILLEAPLPVPELQKQLAGSRAAKKLVARYIGKRELREAKALLDSLLQDDYSEVRAEAIVATSRLFPEERKKLAHHWSDPYFAVKLAALFSMALDKDPTAMEKASLLLTTAAKKEREELAGMFGCAGPFGEEMAGQLLGEFGEEMVALNLAIAASSERAKETLYNGIVHLSDLLMNEEGILFPYLTQSSHLLEPAIINYPDLVDKEIRLELIWRLHLKGDPRAFQAMRIFLKKQGWGIPVLASLLLTSEGSIYDEEFVRTLLDDDNQEIRLQAALFFSLRDQDGAMFSILAEAYPTLSREKQEVVLSAMGKIQSDAAERFLIQELGAEQPSIRLIAAMWILSRYYG